MSGAKVREAAERLRSFVSSTYASPADPDTAFHHMTRELLTLIRALLAALDEEEKANATEIVSVRFRYADGSESLVPAQTFTREQAIALGIPIHPDAVAVRLYGATIATPPEPDAPEEPRE